MAGDPTNDPDGTREGTRDGTRDETRDETRDRPMRLVRGDASPEEVAAVLAVLSAASAGEPEPAPRHTSQWSSPARAVRRPLTPGPGAWRASAWPH